MCIRDRYATINIATLTLILEGHAKSKPYLEEVRQIATSEINSSKNNYWAYFCLAQEGILSGNNTADIIEVYHSALGLNPTIEDLRSEYEQLEFLKSRNIEKGTISEVQRMVFSSKLDKS